jgi:hypothetical protein
MLRIRSRSFPQASSLAQFTAEDQHDEPERRAAFDITEWRQATRPCHKRTV